MVSKASDPDPEHPTITPAVIARLTARTPKPLAPHAGRIVHLTGTIQEGVERGCIVLVDDSGGVLANLMGLAPEDRRWESRVTVEGSFVLGMMTTCQQGRPFRVSRTSPAPRSTGSV